MLDKNSSEEQLKSSRKETVRLRAENARLRAMLGIPDSVVERGSPPEVNINRVSPLDILRLMHGLVQYNERCLLWISRRFYVLV